MKREIAVGERLTYKAEQWECDLCGKVFLGGVRFETTHEHIVCGLCAHKLEQLKLTPNGR